MSTATFSYQEIKQVIRQFTGQANTIATPRVLIKLTGDIVAAVWLGQLLYWTDRTNDPDGWVYKSAIEWNEELEMSRTQVDRVSKALAPLGVETKLKKVKNAPTLHYRINMAVFIPAFMAFIKSNSDFQESSKSIDFQESSKSIYRDYQETTESQFPLNAKLPAQQNTMPFSQPIVAEPKKRGRKPKSEVEKVQAEEVKNTPEHKDYLKRKKDIETAYVELIGYTPYEFGSIVRASKALASAGYDGSHVRGCWNHMMTGSEFWAKKKAAGEPIELASIAKNIPAWWSMEQNRRGKAEKARKTQQAEQEKRQAENANANFLTAEQLAERARQLRAQSRVSAQNMAQA